MSLLVLLPLMTGIFFVSPLIGGAPVPSFKNTCDMDACNGLLPECPCCPSSGFVNPYARQAAEFHFLIPCSSLGLIDLSHLSNQEFVKLIFRPPKSIL